MGGLRHRNPGPSPRLAPDELRGRRGAFVDTKLAMADIAYDVLLETGVHIQPLPIWEDEWEHPESYSNLRLLQIINGVGIHL